MVDDNYPNSGRMGTDDHFMDVESGKAVRPSPSKTPGTIERRMYQHGETRTGGFVVRFTLRDGKRSVCSRGESCELISIPGGYVADDIIDVVLEGHPRRNLCRTGWIGSLDWK